jgi:hypothetical protein
VVGGGWAEWVDGELIQRKLVAGKSLRPRSLAGGSVRGWLIHVKGKTTVLFSGVVVNEGLGWRRSTTSGRHDESEQ